jgi:hypothetical protein
MTHQSIIFCLLLLLPHCKLFTIINKGKKLTVQVTSKGLCFSFSNPENNECVAPRVGGLAITAPLPPSLGPLSLPQGHRVTGRGWNHCWSAPDSYAPTRISHGSDPSQYDIATVIFDGSPFTIKGTRLQAHRSRIAVLWGINKGGWGRDDPGERRH